MNLHKGNIARLIRIMAIVITIIPALSACRKYAGDEQAVARSLAVADSLRYDHPSITDSILRSLCPDSLGSSANNALYAVLANEAGLYSENAFEADSIADIAIEHYRLRSWLSDSCRRLYARALMQKALSHAKDNEYDKAIKSTQQAYNVLDSSDYSSLGDYHKLMNLVYACGKTDMHIRISHLKFSAYNYSKAKLPIQSAQILNDIGASYRIAVDMDSALHYLNLAQQVIDTIDNTELKAANLAYRAGRHYLMKDYRNAIAVANDALRLNNNYKNAAETKYVLCSSYVKLGMPDSALIISQIADFDTTIVKEQLMYLSTLHYITSLNRKGTTNLQWII